MGSMGKEAYVVRWALLTWRHFLEGSQVPFELWTDHKKSLVKRFQWHMH